jgi:short-subunit dehydrogenase
MKPSKTILITGGSDGLGKAIASRLTVNNKVIILSPHEDKLRQAAEELGCEYKVCDVRDYAQIEKTVQEIGTIDCLVNNAGLWIEGPLDENNPQQIHEVLEVNTLGTINMTKAVTPTMKQQKSGRIINVISQAGLHAKPERSIYTASKWAITGFTKSIQAELAPFGVGVTGLYPGKLRTDLFSKAGVEKNMDDALDTDEVAKAVEFILGLESTTLLPEVGIKNL